MTRPLAFLLLVLAAAALFTLAPQTDLWFSGLFYRPGAGFYLGAAPPVELLYHLVPLLTWIIGALSLLAILLAALGLRAFGGGRGRAALFLLLALIIGPGLLVNTVLKDHWGRARPSQVTEFGGSKAFTPALVPSRQCERNCSFVSGHAAIGFYLVSFAFVVPAPRRRAVLATGLALGSLIGLARIAQGGHFLSDVVFAALLVIATSWILHRLVVASDWHLRLHRRVSAWLAARLLRWLACWAAATGATVAVLFLFFDRPIAVFFHGQSESLHAVFRIVTEAGVSTGWLIGAALLWLGLRLAARLPRFAAKARRLEAWSWRPLFFFAAITASGLLTDILKVVFGRMRPKLLFADGAYGFTWWADRADHWSFPSGHTTTAVAIAAALSVIWPRWRPLFILYALLIAASRIIITAHYASDTVMAAFVAVVATRYVAFVFAGGGIDLAAPSPGAPAPRPPLPWRARLGLGRPAAPSSDSP